MRWLRNFQDRCLARSVRDVCQPCFFHSLLDAYRPHPTRDYSFGLSGSSDVLCRCCLSYVHVCMCALFWVIGVHLGIGRIQRHRQVDDPAIARCKGCHPATEAGALALWCHVSDASLSCVFFESSVCSAPQTCEEAHGLLCWWYHWSAPPAKPERGTHPQPCNPLFRHRPRARLSVRDALLSVSCYLQDDADLVFHEKKGADAAPFADSDGWLTEMHVTIHQGRHHQVRRLIKRANLRLRHLK